jgi:hypothetical protein
MQNTKLVIALASIGVAGLVASHPASAQIATANSGNSDLIAVVVDTKTGESFFDNLGILALPSSLLTSQSFNLATAGGSAWSTFVTDTGSDPLSFAVFGGGNRTGAADPVINPGSNPPYPLNSYSITVGGSGSAATPNPPSNGNLTQFNLIDQSIIGPLNSGTYNVHAGTGYDTNDSSEPEYTDASFLTSVNGKFSGVTDVAAGSPNDFYNFTQTKTATSTTTTPSTATLLGTFTFSGSTLAFAAAGGSTAVPLPAAVWLLGGGLFGLVGIGRRRAA